MWIYSGSMEKLDAATWLRPTQELRALGWRVTLVATGNPSQTDVRGVRVSHIATPDVFLLRQIVFHMRVLKMLSSQRNDTDIILFHEASAPWLLLFSIWLKMTGKGRPLFVMDTRTLPMEPEDRATWKDRLRGVYSIQMNKMANRSFDGRTTITDRMAESLKIPSKKLWGVWPSGVKLENFSAASQNRVWPKNDEPINLLYIGCMHHERNLLALAEAVTQANASTHLFTLTIVGDGNGRLDLEKYAREQGKHVNIIPPVPHEEIPKWLSEAHIGALPFPDEEKFRVSSPIKLFEYLAAGLPILATRIDCHTDVIGDKDIVFWVNGSGVQALYAALLEINEKREKLFHMGQDSSRLARQWTWQSSANKLRVALEFGIKEKGTL